MHGENHCGVRNPCRLAAQRTELVDEFAGRPDRLIRQHRIGDRKAPLQPQRHSPPDTFDQWAGSLITRLLSLSGAGPTIRSVLCRPAAALFRCTAQSGPVVSGVELLLRPLLRLHRRRPGGGTALARCSRHRRALRAPVRQALLCPPLPSRRGRPRRAQFGLLYAVGYRAAAALPRSLST